MRENDFFLFLCHDQNFSLFPVTKNYLYMLFGHNKFTDGNQCYSQAVFIKVKKVFWIRSPPSKQNYSIKFPIQFSSINATDFTAIKFNRTFKILDVIYVEKDMSRALAEMNKNKKSNVALLDSIYLKLISTSAKFFDKKQKVFLMLHITFSFFLFIYFFLIFRNKSDFYAEEFYWSEVT